MTLLLWTGRDVEAEVVAVLRSRGVTDRSTEACRAWVRILIRGIAPHWPRQPLSPQQIQLLGARFCAIRDATR